MTSKLPLKHFKSVGALIEQLRAMKMAPSAGIAADVLEVLILRPSAEEGYRDALADRLVADALRLNAYTHDDLRLLVSDEDMRKLLNSTDVGSGRARLAAILSAISGAQGTSSSPEK